MGEAGRHRGDGREGGRWGLWIELTWHGRLLRCTTSCRNTVFGVVGPELHSIERGSRTRVARRANPMCVRIVVTPKGDQCREEGLPGFAARRNPPGKGADPRRVPDRHDRDQWQRPQSLPNFSYTDGSEFSSGAVGN